MIKLSPKKEFRLPIVAECINPEIFEEKSINEIAKLDVWEGNKRKVLGDLFKIEKVEEETGEPTIQIIGDIRRVRKIGANMSRGEIIIKGNAGMYLGEEMKGGKITVYGDADSWLGSMMRGGTIEVMGDAGDYVGATYRGRARGMNGGLIIIHGNAGNEVGCYMRKGLIKIYGNVGQFAGIHMKGGTIFIQGDSAGRAGAEMVKGKIVICGHIPSVLPSFTIDRISPRVKVNGENLEGPFYTFIGDLTENGDGKLHISKVKNPHLKVYEEYL